MSSDHVQSVSFAAATGQEGGSSIMSNNQLNRQLGVLGLQRTASKDLGSALSDGMAQGAFGNAPQDGGLGLQRTMSRDMGEVSGAHQGGLQRTMSRDLGGGAGPQPGGLQRTMSRDLGALGSQPGGLQRTMSKDLRAGNAQPGGGGGLQRTMSSGLGNVQSGGVQRNLPRDPLRQARKTSGKAERVPRSGGSKDSLPRHNVGSS